MTFFYSGKLLITCVNSGKSKFLSAVRKTHQLSFITQNFDKFLFLFENFFNADTSTSISDTIQLLKKLHNLALNQFNFYG